MRLLPAVLGLLWACPAHAQLACSDRSTLIQGLTAKYGEHMVGGGLQSEQYVFEVWVSDEKGTWTIIMSGADGRSCIMASGTNWRKAPPVISGVPG